MQTEEMITSTESVDSDSQANQLVSALLVTAHSEDIHHLTRLRPTNSAVVLALY